MWFIYDRLMEKVSYYMFFCLGWLNFCSVSYYDLVNILCFDFDNFLGDLLVEMK